MKTEMRTNTKIGKVMSFFVMAILALSFVTPGVLAQEDTDVEVELEEAGIGPDSIFHGLDRAMERISLAFTFDKAEKAEKRLLHAEERLAEVRAMVEANNLEAAEKGQELYEETLEEVGDLADEIESDDDLEETEEALEKVLRVREKIRVHSEKVSLVKQRILERQAERMTEEQIAHMREVFGKIEAKAFEVESKIEQKKDRIGVRYKVKAELTDDELEGFELKLKQRIKERDGDRNGVSVRMANGSDDEDDLVEVESEDNSESDSGSNSGSSNGNSKEE